MPDPTPTDDPIPEVSDDSDSANEAPTPVTDTSDVEQPLRGGGDSDSEYDEINEYDHLIDGNDSSDDEEDSNNSDLFGDIW